MNAANDPQFHRDRSVATSLILLPCITGISAALATLRLLWHDAPEVFMPLPGVPFSDHLSHWLSGLFALLTNGSIGAKAWGHYTDWVAHLDPAVRWALYARLALALAAGAACAALTALWMVRSSGSSAPVRGRALLSGGQAIRQLSREARREWRKSGEDEAGIHLHPDVPISQDRETKHFLVMGASGSGKTNIIWHILQQAIARGDRVVLFDSKGDFTSELRSMCLLAPWDSRGMAWDIAQDCVGPLDAQSLAARLIPDNDKDPMWPNASRALLVALLVHLQTVKAGSWTFSDLRELLHLPIGDLRLIAQQHNPEALRSLEDGSRITQSILINLLAFMAPVVDMARASSTGQQKRFSMRQWVEGKTRLSRTVVIQGSQRFDQTAAALMNSLLSVMAATIASPGLPDDKTRRIWLVLDEFAQLGQLRDIGPLIRMGRSKGLRIVIGAQDVAELRAIYGTHRTDGWTSSLTTSIYTRLEGGATAEWVSRRIGEQEIVETNESKTQGGSGTSQTRQRSLRRSPTVLPAELKTLIGARPDGVHALIDGFDQAVYLVKFPYHQPKRLRAGTRYADWVEPPPPAAGQPGAGAAPSTLPVRTESSPERTGDHDTSPGKPASFDEPAARAAASPARTKRWGRRSPPSGDGGSRP